MGKRRRGETKEETLSMSLRGLAKSSRKMYTPVQYSTEWVAWVGLARMAAIDDESHVTSE